MTQLKCAPNEPALFVPPTESPPRVVLIDDNVNLLRILAEMLPEMGIDVAAVAYDGIDALPTVQSMLADGIWIDVVVMDERMPQLNGIEATRVLAENVPWIKVVLNTAYAGQLSDAPAKAGVFAQVAKGCGSTELIDAIRRACTACRHAAISASYDGA